MEEKDKEIGIKKFFCPHCGAEQMIDARFCSKCGAYLVLGEGKEEEKGEKNKLSNKKSKQKKLIILGIVLSFLVFISSVVFWWFSSSQKRLALDYQNKVNAAWEEIYQESLLLKETFLKTQKIEDLSSFQKPIADLQKTLNEKSLEVGEIIPPSRYKESYNNLKEFFPAFLSYLSKLDEITGNPLNYGSQDNLLELQDKAQQAQRKLQQFTDTTKFISKTLPSEIFDVSSLRQLILKFQEDEEAKKKEEERKKEEESAKQPVLNFMQELSSVYSQANPFDYAKKIAQKYWFSSALAVFEDHYFVYFKESGVFYKGGRILNIEKMSEGKYVITCEEYAQFPVNVDNKESSSQTKLTYFIVEKNKENYLISGHGNR